ncbi:MAG: dockerin type I domain-containing protein [Candidatus Bathyarchaeota archaeon]
MKKPLLTMITLMLIITLYVNNSTFIVHAGNIQYLDLPYNSTPLGLVFNPKNLMVYIALFATRQLAEVNVSKVILKESNPYTLYDIGYSIRTVTIDGEGNVWIAGEYLMKFDIKTKSFTIVTQEYVEFYSVTYYNGFIWARGLAVSPPIRSFLLKVNTTTLEYISYYVGSYRGCIHEDKNLIWISNLENNSVSVFDITLGCIVETIYGFNRPFGLEVDSKYVYVAEAKKVDEAGLPMGTIAVIDKENHSNVFRLETALVTYEGPYQVLKDSFGYLWFTDNSGHFGIVGGIVFNSRSPYNYYMCEVSVGVLKMVWFSGHGSDAYVGMKETGTLGKIDVNLDGKIDIKDILTVALAYGSTPWANNWNPVADVTGDGKVDIRDMFSVALGYGKTI